MTPAPSSNHRGVAVRRKHRQGTAFLGTFADENEEVLVFVKDGAAMVGDQLEVTGGYYENVFYETGDPFDGTYTVRCQP